MTTMATARRIELHVTTARPWAVLAWLRDHGPEEGLWPDERAGARILENGRAMAVPVVCEDGVDVRDALRRALAGCPEPVLGWDWTNDDEVRDGE